MHQGQLSRPPPEGKRRRVAAYAADRAFGQLTTASGHSTRLYRIDSLLGTLYVRVNTPWSLVELDIIYSSNISKLFWHIKLERLRSSGTAAEASTAMDQSSWVYRPMSVCHNHTMPYISA